MLLAAGNRLITDYVQMYFLHQLGNRSVMILFKIYNYTLQKNKEVSFRTPRARFTKQGILVQKHNSKKSANGSGKGGGGDLLTMHKLQ